MRIIAKKTLMHYLELKKYHFAKESLKSWCLEAEKSLWETTSELKEQFKAASIINNKRVVFNIQGNHYRLVVDIEYRLRIIFVVWFGTHEEYNEIDVKNINFRSDKK